MKIEQMQEAITPHIPQIIAGAANTFFTAFLFGAAAFAWWYIKRRITRKEDKEDERGPVLYKKEHDDKCHDVESDHGEKIDEVLSQIKSLKSDQAQNARDNKAGLHLVHRRIDGTNKIMVQHLEAELARK